MFQEYSIASPLFLHKNIQKNRKKKENYRNLFFGKLRFETKNLKIPSSEACIGYAPAVQLYQVIPFTFNGVKMHYLVCKCNITNFSRSRKNAFLILPLCSAALFYFLKCLIYYFKVWRKLVLSHLFLLLLPNL